jgi:hypothetical protein
MLASLSPGGPGITVIARTHGGRSETDIGVAREGPRAAAPVAGPHDSFNERFAPVFWPFGQEDDESAPGDLVATEPAAGDALGSPLLSTRDSAARTAIYVIAEHAVYLPNGERLEAHSGLGRNMDNPRYVNVSNRGATPPNVYDLALRSGLFHGVRAIRLIPVDEDRMFGRGGMLAHSYMLGSNGQSNGCVVFRDYPAFLHAFLRGEVERLVVVDHLDGPARKPGGGLAQRTRARRVASR